MVRHRPDSATGEAPAPRWEPRAVHRIIFRGTPPRRTITICGLEIGLAVFGLLALVRGKMPLSKTKVVVGVPARLLGLVALAPVPLALGAIIAFTAVNGGFANLDQFATDNQRTTAGIEAAVLIGVAILVFGTGAVLAISPAEAEHRERVGRSDDSGPARSPEFHRAESPRDEM